MELIFIILGIVVIVFIAFKMRSLNAQPHSLSSESSDLEEPSESVFLNPDSSSVSLLSGDHHHHNVVSHHHSSHHGGFDAGGSHHGGSDGGGHH